MPADWYCPECGHRLSYGVYCKKCGEERDFAIRPAGEVDRLMAYCKTMPAPERPLAGDDLHELAGRIMAEIEEQRQ